MYKIRFHLGRGENFMKWQVKTLVSDGSDIVQYFEPDEYQLAMFKSKLKVQPAAAKKIHEGACKTVCAWVECEELQILGSADFVKPNVNDFYVRFNPRTNPNWVNMQGDILSDEKYELIVTQDRSLFVVNDYHECDVEA